MQTYTLVNPTVESSLTIGQLVDPIYELTEPITQLVNEAYTLGEAGMWVDGTLRTSAGEIKNLTDQKRLIVAFNNQELLGAVKITKQNATCLEFGQLAVKKRLKRSGVGKQLIQYVENYALQEGYRAIKLEILYPTAGFELALPENESVDMNDSTIAAWKKKALLHKIYTGMDYKIIKVGDMSEFALDYPELVNALAVPCKYVTYEKLFD